MHIFSFKKLIILVCMFGDESHACTHTYTKLKKEEEKSTRE